MSREHYNDDCPGCQPVLFEPSTGQVLGADHPAMRTMARVFATLKRGEKEAWHRFTCQNSRAPADLLVIAMIRRKMEKAMPTE